MTPTRRIGLIFCAVLALAAAAAAAIIVLQRRSDDSRVTQLQIAEVKKDLHVLQIAPFQASKTTGGSPALASMLLRTGRKRIGEGLAAVDRADPPASVNGMRALFAQDNRLLDRIYTLGATGVGYGREADQLAGRSEKITSTLDGMLSATSDEYAKRAAAARRQATLGSVGVILALLSGFGFFLVRSVRARSRAERLATENERLAAVNREEAVTDSLTGIRNRRGLTEDLEAQIRAADNHRPLILTLFDLDGFKEYNDTFGHPAGDTLLAQVGGQLATALAGMGTAYRIGGDEFCMLAPIGADGGDEIIRLAAAALTQTGEGFTVGCSHGTVWIPTEANSAEGALQLADQRMYSQKAARTSASRQTTDVLLQVLSECTAGPDDHISHVTRFARGAAERMGLPEHEVGRIALAAQLHDVGKCAIPDAILDKPGKLDAREWEFIHRHTVIGERIVLAAPALAHTAKLVRSSHERFDGTGYPDGLCGDAIPMGAAIIAVCDAFEAMTTERPYRAAITAAEALVELRRCAGTQFDPRAVHAFCSPFEGEDADQSLAAGAA
ncbi:MAG: hypothetical protein QOG68_1031 [Solirubrobacteraceae bacterium]|nr:hypothetical protein [Solirubrobacteraceae bacterium]